MSKNNASKKNNNSKAARDALNRYKIETTNELGIDLSNTDTLLTVDSGKVGGSMVRKIIDTDKNS